jgi:hypothetical protein
VIVGVFILFAGLNIVAYLLLRLFFGRFFSVVLIFLGYYILARNVINYFVFPGSFKWNRRHMEFGFGQ